MQKNCIFCMTILNCWYGTTENWRISWGISFHTNASTSVAVINGTSFSFLRTCSYLMLQCHQNSKFGSLWLGLTFQIENPLSCRRVWKVDLWHIRKNKISQDLCSTVTVNKHTIKDQKVTAMVNWIQCWTNFKLLNLMLHFVLPSFSLFSIFQLSSTVFAFSGLNTVGSSLRFSVLFLLLCYFNILFYSWHCVYSL